MSLKYLSKSIAQKIDVELMSNGGFSIYQLMELAGLSVAASITQEYDKNEFKNILICCGPGNNGGDGLVAARHLKHFGYEPIIYYPKKNDKDIFKGLIIQLKNLEVSIYESFEAVQTLNYQLIVDAIFGFSFKYTGIIKEPFEKIIEFFSITDLPIVAVDVPSGWPVDEDEYQSIKSSEKEKLYQPEMLISLTAPKQCAKFFKGKYHYLGGRFIANNMIKEYQLSALPAFNGMDQFVKLDDYNR